MSAFANSPCRVPSSSDSARVIASQSDVEGKAQPNPPALRGGAILDHHTNVTTTAESSRRDARAEAQYLLNTISADFLQMGDVLHSTKPAAGGLMGGGLCGFDA